MLVSVQFLVKSTYWPRTASCHNRLAPLPLISPSPLNSCCSVESFAFVLKSDLYLNEQNTASVLVLWAVLTPLNVSFSIFLCLQWSALPSRGKAAPGKQHRAWQTPPWHISLILAQGKFLPGFSKEFWFSLLVVVWLTLIKVTSLKLIVSTKFSPVRTQDLINIFSFKECAAFLTLLAQESNQKMRYTILPVAMNVFSHTELKNEEVCTYAHLHAGYFQQPGSLTSCFLCSLLEAFAANVLLWRLRFWWGKMGSP